MLARYLVAVYNAASDLVLIFDGTLTLYLAPVEHFHWLLGITDDRHTTVSQVASQEAPYIGNHPL